MNNIQVFHISALFVKSYLTEEIYNTVVKIIWSRHCLDASRAFLSGQCVYI